MKTSRKYLARAIIKGVYHVEQEHPCPKFNTIKGTLLAGFGADEVILPLVLRMLIDEGFIPGVVSVKGRMVLVVAD